MEIYRLGKIYGPSEKIRPLAENIRSFAKLKPFRVCRVGTAGQYTAWVGVTERITKEIIISIACFFSKLESNGLIMPMYWPVVALACLTTI